MIPLVSTDCINNWLIKDELFHTSHHAIEGFLGGGMLYYSLAYLCKSACSVCLGSGSGFVPRIMKQAQYDLGIDGETILIDADLPEAGWGDPDYHNRDCFFKQNFDIQIIKAKTDEAIEQIRGKRIDYLHIDADHSYEWVKHDYFAYKELLRPNAITTFHDSMVCTGVQPFIKELKENPRYEVVNIEIGTGVALVRELP